MIDAVEQVYSELNPSVINDTFLTYQKCLEMSMSVKGGNHYAEPHLNKSRRRSSTAILKYLTRRGVHCRRTKRRTIKLDS